MSRTVNAISWRRMALALATVGALLAMSLAPADARERRKRTIVIGDGVIGAIIDGLSTQSYKKKKTYSGKTQRSKQNKKKKNTYTGKTQRSKSGTRKAKRDDKPTTKRTEVAREKPAEPVEPLIEATEPTAVQVAPVGLGQTAPVHPTAPATQPTAVMQAAPALAVVPATQSMAAPAGSAPVITLQAEIQSAQEHLRYLGYDVQDATGVMDLKTKIAVMQFQDSLGADTTGDLTTEQLRALFQKAANKTAQTQ